MIGNSIFGLKGQQNIFMDNSYQEVAGYGYVRDEKEKSTQNHNKNQLQKYLGAKIEIK